MSWSRVLLGGGVVALAACARVGYDPPGEPDAAVDAGERYVLLTTARSWTDSDAACAALGLHLAHIESRAEQDLVFAGVAGRQTVWIGATDLEVDNTWRWSLGGTPFWQGTETGQAIGGAFVFWFPGREPNDAGGAEHCAVMNGDDPDGEWTDFPCELPYPAVCELP